jgi:cytochrome b561
MIEPGFLKLINNIFNLVFILALAFLVGAIIYLGIIYITSSKEEALKEVHKRWGILLWGLVLVFLSRTIPKLIEMFFE